MINSRVVVLPFLLTTGVYGIAYAQTPPTAGSLNQQIEREQAPRLPSKAPPEIRIQQGAAPAAPVSNQMKIAVTSLHLTGLHAFSENELIAASGFKQGSEFTLAELRNLASKISDYYHRHGYFLAQAYLPAQDIKDGVVTIALLEGQYGKVSLRNQTNLSDSLANGLLGGLDNNETVTIAPLENRLLLLSDLPGVSAKSTLIPGASVGTSDLIVELTPGQRVTGSVDADNEGNRYTGNNRVGATVNVNEPFGFGDILTLRAQSSLDSLNYGRASYQGQLGRAKAGVAYSSMNYRLGKEFASLNANGTAKIASVYGSYPLIRTRANNLNAVIDFDAKTFSDKVDSTSTVTDKKAQVWMMSLNGDSRDGLGGGGVNNYSFTWSSGSINIQSAAALATDAATVHSNGHFDKLGFSAFRLQGINETTSLYAAIQGQFASKNLDTSEKMSLGGATAVRAYPAGETNADQGYVLNLEARRVLPHWWDSLPGQMQLIGFVDTGTATLNKNAWSAGQNRKTLSGTGIGLNWSDNSSFAVKAYYARKLGTAVATSAPDAMTRFWLQGIKYF